MTIELTDDDRALLRAALDSHIYWQLADERYRHDGFVLPPGADDDETRATIARCEALAARLPEGGRS